MKNFTYLPFMVLIFAFLTALVGCGTGNADISNSDLSTEQIKWVDETLAGMTTEQKLGQLLCPALAPPRTDSDQAPFNQVKEWIEKYHIGNVYMASNRMDPVRTAKYLNAIQQESDLPLLVHSDMEPGPGGRFDGGTILPPLMGLAQTRSEDLVYEAASITAREMRAIGIHLINSPVLDVNINPDNPVICIRSFGDNPGLIAKLGKAYVRGLNDNGLIGAAKHFPGHGDVSVDSHSNMPTINAPRDRLDSIEFFPYREVIPAGLRAVMTAHISIPALDPSPGLPATMSKPIMTDVLRGELGFKGILITDAFDMGGILESGSFEGSALQSILAGNDIVLLWTRPRFETVFPYLINAVKEGTLSDKRLNESVRRVLVAKAFVGLNKVWLVDTEMVNRVVNIPEHQEQARLIYEKSLTLVKNEGGILPLPATGQKIAVLSVNDDEGHPEIGRTFINELRSRTDVSSGLMIDPQTTEEDMKKALRKTEEADVIVVGLFARIMARRGSASLRDEQVIDLMETLADCKKTVFVVSFGSPYLIGRFPGVSGYLIATEPTWDFYGYDKHRPGQIAAARALCGEIDIGGKLAVNIPGLYPFGHGIEFSSKD